jgi:predicted nucleotidyltransferase
MSTLGIIAEYNPMHNGHLYHITESKKISGADTVVCVMSGNFVQRGMPAILSKQLRANHAILNGVDLVIEIPTVFTVASSNVYAKAGVMLLESLNCDYISFGSEEGNIDKLSYVSNNLLDKRLDEYTKSFCSEGLSYPRARELAYTKFFEKEDSMLLRRPNNILAIEYLKYIKTMKPVTVKREGSAYDDSAIEYNMKYQSASAIRRAVYDNISVKGYVPDISAEDLLKGDRVNYETLFQLLRYRIITGNAEEFEKCPSGGEGLGNKLKNEINKASSFEELAELIKSKRYTRTRINRLLTQVLLGIDREKIDYNNVGYVKFLACNQKGAKILNKCKLDVVSNINKMHIENEVANYYMEKDLLAGDIYNILSGKNLYINSEKALKPNFIP